MADLTGICVLTADLPRLRSFYRWLLELEPQEDGEDFCSFPAGSQASLSLLESGSMEAWAPGATAGAAPGSFSLEFRTDHLDEAYPRLLAGGVEILRPPETYSWGRRAVWFKDPDGNLVSLYQPVDRSEGGRKALFRSYFERLLNDKDLAVCDDMLAANYIDHDAPGAVQPSETRSFAAHLLQMYPDLRVAVDDVIAGGDCAAGRVTWRGRHALTGEPFHQVGMVILRFDAGGMIAERWSVYEKTG